MVRLNFNVPVAGQINDNPIRSICQILQINDLRDAGIRSGRPWQRPEKRGYLIEVSDAAETHGD